MKTVIETTAKNVPEAIRQLGIADDETVRISVGTKQTAYRQFLNAARELQESAARNGMTPEIHDELLESIKADRDLSREIALEEVTNTESIPRTPFEKLCAVKGAGARIYGPRTSEEIDADIREFRGD